MLTSCAKKERKDPPVSTNFSTFLDRFNVYSKERGFDYELEVSALEIKYDFSLSGTNTLAYCSYPRFIGINKDYWEMWASNGRSNEMEQLIFHELGHCILHRGHNNTTRAASNNGENIPTTIMNAYHISDNYYNINYNYYINELFNVSITGSYAMYSGGVSNFPKGIYASTIKTDYIELYPKNEYVSEITITDFKCEDDNEFEY